VSPSNRTAAPGEAEAPAAEREAEARPELDGADVAASLGLLGKLLSGLDRIIECEARADDTRLLVKGSVIDAFATLAGVQIKLLQLRRELNEAAAPSGDPVEFAARLRAAQREMEALTRGRTDAAMDRAAVPSHSASLSG
jgi:hypothetical protein